MSRNLFRPCIKAAGKNRRLLNPISQSVVYRSSSNNAGDDFKKDMAAFSKLIGQQLKGSGYSDPKPRRVVVTGVGSISSLGSDSKKAFKDANEGKSGVTKIAQGGYRDDPNLEHIYWGRQQIGAKVPDHCSHECDEVCGGADRSKTPAMMFAEYASVQALLDVGKYYNISPDEYNLTYLKELYHLFHASA
jgi:hypothetical protein